MSSTNENASALQFLGISLTIRFFLALSLAVLVGAVVIGEVRPLVVLSENQALYLYSSISQVVAAIFGLTISGYVFLRNQQDRFIEKDDTLVEIYAGIQGRQFKIIVLLTAFSAVCISGSLASIAAREVAASALTTLVFNASSSLFIINLAWHCFFVIDAMKPGRVVNASEAIKSEIEEETGVSGRIEGKLEDFLVNFNRIEQLLERFAERYLNYAVTVTSGGLEAQALENRRKKMPRWGKSKILRAMVSKEIIDVNFEEQLSNIIRYRNALVHGNDMSVSAEMVEKVQFAKQRLEKCLHAYLGDDYWNDQLSVA